LSFKYFLSKYFSIRVFLVALVAVIATTLTVMVTPTPALAQDGGTIDSESIFGTLETPPGVDKIQETQAPGDIGLLVFISRLIRIGTVISGLWTVGNLLLAGYTYASSKGDAAAHTKVRDIITLSAVGLMIIITSYTIAGVLGLLLFNDATYIINPKLVGPTTTGLAP
jgi:hypothetical protein